MPLCSLLLPALLRTLVTEFTQKIPEDMPATSHEQTDACLLSLYPAEPKQGWPLRSRSLHSLSHHCLVFGLALASSLGYSIELGIYLG